MDIIPGVVSLAELLSPHPAPCVTFFLGRAHDGQRVDSLRLKSLLVEAEKLLVASGMVANHERASELLQPVWRLVGSDAFWHGLHPHVTLFCAHGFFRQSLAAHHLKEHVAIGRHFHLRPLLGAIDVHHRFLLAAISHDDVRLFSGGDDGLRPAPVPIPGHRSATDLDRKTIGAATGHGTTVFFGSSARENHDQDRLRAYFREVAQVIHQHYAGTPQPVILAGLDHQVAMFRSVAGKLNLFPDAVITNPEVEAMPLTELGKRAMTVAKPFLERERSLALRRLHERSTHLPLAREPWAIIEASRRGQIETLFTDREAQAWGTYDESSGRPEIHPLMVAGDEDLINVAVINTLRHHGAVYEVGHGELEPGAKAVAVLRYLADSYQVNASR